MDVASSSQASSRQGLRAVATAVDHPRLTKTNSTTIRAFLRDYDQYAREVRERAQQITGKNVMSTDIVKPVQMKFCVNSEWLESVIDLGFIPDVTNYDSLQDEELRSYLGSKAASSKDVVTIDMLDKIVEENLRIDMSDKDARSRIENLFVSYLSILRRHGLSWITKDNEKVAVYHVLSCIRPESLRTRLESDLDLSHYDLRKNFKGFMDHAIKLSEAFQLVDNGSPTKSTKTRKTRKGGKRRDNDDKNGKDDADKDNGGNSGKDGDDSSLKRNTPVCLWPPHKSKGIRHFLRDCKGPAGNTRSKTRKTETDETDKTEAKTVGRVTTAHTATGSSFEVTFIDGNESQEAKGRADDGADESIVSSRVAERAVLNGIGKMKKSTPVTMQVALKDGSDAKSFKFSRVWTTPLTVLKLAAGPLALLNVEYLVADNDLAAEDLLIGLPVLRHLKIDTKTLLEDRRDLLDGTDCTDIQTSLRHGKHGKVGRLMIARLNSVSNDAVTDKENKKTTVSDTVVKTRETAIDYYEVREEEDPFPDASTLDPLDVDQKDDIDEGINKMLGDASDNGLPKDDKDELRQLVTKNIDLFRTAFSSGPPAKVEPLRIALTPDAKPTRVRLRNYSQDQREFLARFVGLLVKADMAYPNPSSAWACAPLLVPKPGPAMFRFTVDLRPVNRFTVKHQFPMPNIEHELAKLSTSRYFAIFDLSHGYWQLPLSKSSQECQSFITPDGIYSPTRVLHGTTNAVMYLQSTLAALMPDDLRPNVMWWLDDILIHSKTVIDHFKAVSLLFQFCTEYNFKLHPGKCTVFATTIRWCGRLISAEGISFDPRRIDGIRQMANPATGADLQQFVCAMQWMRAAIPEFSSIIRPLADLLESVYAHVGKRTRLAAGRVSLSAVGWCSEHDKAFDRCKIALKQQVTLSHVDPKKRLCVYTDASDFFWSGIVTQIPTEDSSLPCIDQRHEPLAFLSGHFTDSCLRWSTIEKEAYAIMATVDRMHGLLASSRGFDLYTDHNNLVFLFNPLSIIADMSQTTLRKVLRWAVRLSAYSYTCVHVPGTDNVWADLLSRWTAPQVLRRLVSVPVLPSSSATDFEWPSIDTILDSQRQYSDSRNDDIRLNSDGVWCAPSGAIWIPNDDTDLQLRLCVIAHTGPSGHRAAKTTSDVLRQHFVWSTITADVETFVQSCIHCLSTVGGGKVPRPYGPAVHGTAANDLLQFDYIEISESTSGEKYVLMLRDDHSNYCWFYGCPETSAEHAARAVIDWCAAFGVPSQLMSDGPTHFKNELLRLVASGLRVPHHFTLPYSPWSNGGVERLGKELLRVFRAVVSELRLEHGEWPDLLPLVQSAINNAPSPQRSGVSPITAMTGLDPTPPISTFYRSSTQAVLTLSDLHRERAMNVDKLIELVGDLHPVVQNTLHHNRSQSRNSSSRGSIPNFMEGDFVLVAREHFRAGEKLCLRWRGPRRVVKAINDYVYQVEDLRNGEIDEIHISRLKFYHDGSLDKEVIMSHVLTSETGMVVHRLVCLVDSEEGLMVQVRWRGLPDSEDTFESIDQVYKDVPELFVKLLNRKNTPPALAQKAKSQLGIM